MLTASFCFLPGIGKQKEKAIWNNGILTWEQFLRTEHIPGISPERKQQYNNIILQCKQDALANKSNLLAAAFPLSEHWRLYGSFKEDALFLDIEVNSKNEPIIIGMYDKEKTMVMVKGVNIDKLLFEKTIAQKKIIITYNGRSFDMPRLCSFFSMQPPSLPHIDLRGLCQRCGLHGGLKEVERLLGIPRPQHLSGHPVDLWKAFFASQDQEYLDLLIQYNEEDTVNLHPIMEKVYTQLIGQWKKQYEET